MGKKYNWLIVLSALLLTMCRGFVSQPVTYANGLSCRNYEGMGDEAGADCTYTCPDGTVKEVNIPDTISPLYGASQDELNAQFCGIELQSTPTEPAATSSPTSAPSTTEAASPTTEASATAEVSPTLEVTGTAEIPVTNQDVLTGRVTMCDISGQLISFRLVQPPPDLTGKTVTAQIAGQDSTCYVNPTNLSLLTCTLPSGVTFPADIAVSMDGAVVSEFTFDGIGCAKLFTPLPTTTP